MTSRFLVVLLVVIGLCSCTSRSASSPNGDRPVSASSHVDQTHRLALQVDLSADGVTTPGITPLRILVHDANGAMVRDAIVYVELSSRTGETPQMTLVATNDSGFYRVDLPLVYGSRWTVVVKAFSSRRNAVLTISEDLS
jgi:hypothetical protein